MRQWEIDCGPISESVEVGKTSAHRRTFADKIRMQHYAALTSHIFMKQAFHDEVYDTDTAILIARHEPQTGIEALKGQRVVDLYRTPSR